MPERCPMCGSDTLEQKTGQFVFKPPPMIPGGPIVIDNASWEECSACHKTIMADALEKAIRAEAKFRGRK
jgi:YgiT-type zinc finger domain-containing protein